MHVVRAGPHRRGPRGVVLHRLTAVEVVSHRGVPVTTPTRTLVDLAASGTDADLTRAVEQARLVRLVTARGLAAGQRGQVGARAGRSSARAGEREPEVLVGAGGEPDEPVGAEHGALDRLGARDAAGRPQPADELGHLVERDFLERPGA